jgi:hypothetical protein
MIESLLQSRLNRNESVVDRERPEPGQALPVMESISVGVGWVVLGKLGSFLSSVYRPVPITHTKRRRATHRPSFFFANHSITS